MLERLALLEMVVTNAREAIVVTEAEPVTLPGPRILFVNSAFTEMTGYTFEDVVGKTPRILQGHGSDGEATTKIRAALDAWQPVVAELLNYRKDGSPFWVELSIVPVADKNGWYTHWLSVQRDVTDRKAVQEALTRARVAEAEAITYAVEVQRRRRVEAALEASTSHDELTGLRNRSHLMDGLEGAIGRHATESSPGIAVLSIDLDRFGQLNETYGHRAGDRCLREVAARLARGSRAGDTLCRTGGNEFVMVLEQTNPNDASLIARRILEAFEAPVDLGISTVDVDLSIGIANLADERWDGETLLQNADAARHDAKSGGGARVAVFASATHARMTHKRLLNSDLLGAIDDDQLRLHYQPIVDVSNGRVSGFEALVRWQHPVHGLLGPFEFIPLAEESGAIVKLGAWVLERACRMAAGWQAMQEHPQSISVNVTSRQLLDTSFVDELERVLERTRLAPQRLQLEITESVLLAGAAVIGPLFQRIRALGVKIAFDDFGTGYSSLGYLERFQIDTLKIDQSFVARIHDTSAKSEILRMIISLAHALGVRVIAEGVELRSQCDALGALGCTDMQGYYFSRPIPEDQIAGLLASAWTAKPELRAILDDLIEATDYELTREQYEELRRQVEGAIATHYGWIARLRDAVDTGRSADDATTVARDDLCSIGRWLHDGIDVKLRASPLYVITKARHAVFHRSAARLISLACAGDASARVSLETGGDFRMVASLMLDALEAWLEIALRNGAAGRIAATG